MLELRSQSKEVHVINVAMGALFVKSNSSTSFLDIINDLVFDQNTREFIVRRLMTIPIFKTYYSFAAEKD